MFDLTFISYESSPILFYGQPLYIYFDIFAAALTLWLIIKIGKGKIRYPLLIFLAGFISSIVLPPFIGNDLEVLMLFKGGVGLLGIAAFITVFGGSALLLHSRPHGKDV
jgi:hypothetical protein